MHHRIPTNGTANNCWPDTIGEPTHTGTSTWIISVFSRLPHSTLPKVQGSCYADSDQIMWRINYYQLDLELTASRGWTRWWYWVGRQLHHSLSRLVSDWRVLQPSQIAKHTCTCTSIKYRYIPLTNSSVTVISAGSQIYTEKTTATTASISSPVKWTIVLWHGSPAILSFSQIFHYE